MPGPRFQSPEQKNTVDRTTRLQGSAVALLILLVAGVSCAVGNQPLTAHPRFSVLYGCCVFLFDAISSYVLFSLFRYRRRPIYAWLGAVYLFVALLMIPYLLSFRSAVHEGSQVIGGEQTSIWIWYFWHFLVPPLIALAVLAHRHHCWRPVANRSIAAFVLSAVTSALALALLVSGLSTHLHTALPDLMSPQGTALVPQIYWAGGLAATISACCAWFCWREGQRQQSVLHFWLALTLLAHLADVLANLGASERYSVSWYLARVESMIASGVLLVFFLGQLNRLYHRLSLASGELVLANRQLGAALRAKDELVAKLRQSDEQIRQLAYRDALTGLPNRRLLLDRLKQELARARRHDHAIAIMFLDLDRFKEVNDTLGHDAGDQLLVLVAQRLNSCLRKGDTAARSGGDEFIIVLPEIARPGDAAWVAEKIIKTMCEPVVIGERPVYASLSIGIAIYTADSDDDLRDLLRKADQAMYAAKSEGCNQYRFYADGEGGKPPTPPAQ